MPRAPAVRNQITPGTRRADGPRVVVLTGDGERRSVPITKSVTIGADADACDLVVSTPGVGRRHARLIPLEGGVAVRDLRSRTGTFRNGRLLVGPEQLDDGDVITVGDVDLRFDVSSGRRPRSRPRSPAAEHDDAAVGPATDAATRGTPGSAGPGPGPAPARPAQRATREARRTALAEALRTALATDAEASSVVPSRAVLLCHDPADRDIADLLVSYLQRRGHAVWIDRSVSPSMDPDGWRGRLLDVVWSSDGALFLVSPASAGSERARREVHTAGAERLPVVPVLVGPTDLAPDLAWYLTQREPIDLRSGPMAGLAALAVAVESLPARRLARPRRVVAGLVLAAALVTAVYAAARMVLG